MRAQQQRKRFYDEIKDTFAVGTLIGGTATLSPLIAIYKEIDMPRNAKLKLLGRVFCSSSLTCAFVLTLDALRHHYTHK